MRVANLNLAKGAGRATGCNEQLPLCCYSGYLRLRGLTQEQEMVAVYGDDGSSMRKGAFDSHLCD